MPIIVEGVNPYTEATALLSRLPELTRNARAGSALTISQQAKAIGIGADTLSGFEAGSNYTKATLLAVLAYLASLV